MSDTTIPGRTPVTDTTDAAATAATADTAAMQAIVQRHYGAADTLALTTVPRPTIAGATPRWATANQSTC